MEVSFGAQELARAYGDLSVGKRFWGEKVAKLYIQRVDALKAAPATKDLAVLRSLAFHPLKRSLAGKYAIRIDGFWRLIFRFTDKAMKAVVVEGCQQALR